MTRANFAGMRLLYAVLLTGLYCLTARAEDWTVDGKAYHNVIVGKIEADRVHITYDGGLGTVMLSDLTPGLQKRFGYDPAKANEAPQTSTNSVSSDPSTTNTDQAFDEFKADVKSWLTPKTASEAVPAKPTALDQKNGFRGYQLGMALTSIDPSTLERGPYLNADDDNYVPKQTDPSLGAAHLDSIWLVFNQGLLNRIELHCTGDQSFAGLKETFIVAYGQPKESWGNLSWEGIHTKLELERILDSVTATFTNKDVQAKVDELTKQKALTAAPAAAKSL